METDKTDKTDRANFYDKEETGRRNSSSLTRDFCFKMQKYGLIWKKKLAYLKKKLYLCSRHWNTIHYDATTQQRYSTS